MTRIEMGPGREFDAIRAILARVGDRARGIGDDAAVLSIPRGERLVTSVDALVDDVHFRRGWLTFPEIGWRATMAALSDLAAMGAAPLGVLVAVALPDDLRDTLEPLADGIAAALRQADTWLLGGNTTRAATLSITTTVLGHAYRPLGRDGVRAGDRVHVTGRLGGPGAALAAWSAGGEPEAAHRARFAAPVARLAEARWLADAGATAAIDVSDGLSADLAHLAHASGLRIDVDADRVPCIDGVDAERALRGGEEYELVVTAPEPIDADAFRRRFGVELTEIGVARASDAPAVEITRGGARVAPPPGHDHFSG